MSPRNILRRYLGDRESIAKSRVTRWLGARLHDSEVWHLGRRSVAGGVSLGFFLAFIPLPIQMLVAAPLALTFRVNLPVTMASLWITNPFTFAPMYLFAYKVGEWITGYPGEVGALAFPSSFSGLIDILGEIWLPLCVGCLVCGCSAAAISNVSVRWMWRAYLLNRRRRRRLERAR
ncbi:MAG: DUF2062 domain-containing protein [Gammaproteobacteria bacterium]|nr:DUF2062 domain-containing protein [Gammaproteobacteria bacterium]